MCACIFVVNHIKERPSGSVVMTSDPGMLRDRGRVAKEEKKTQSTRAHRDTHKRKRVGYTLQHLNLQQLQKQAQREAWQFVLLTFMGTVNRRTHK